MVDAVKCVWQHQQNYNVSPTSVFMIRHLRGKKKSSSLRLNSDTRSLKIATVMFLYLSGDVSWSLAFTDNVIQILSK